MKIIYGRIKEKNIKNLLEYKFSVNLKIFTPGLYMVWENIKGNKKNLELSWQKIII